ncbi:MFS transporter [Agromyces binzhouensis]|uniref:MFS transporter n=1 Tax=Agromyces binzhouensis TaxID=1817495 RepID=UPI00362DABC0
MRSEKVVLPLLLFAAFLTFADRAVLPPLFTTVAVEFAVDPAVVAIAMTAYVAAYAIGQLGWGIASTRLGRIRVIVLALVVASLGQFGTAVAWDPVSLAVARIVAGAGFAAIVPAALVWIGDHLDLRSRGVAAANLAAALSLGMTAGTLGAAFAGDLGVWRLVPIGATVLGVVLAVLFARVREPAPAAPSQPVLAGFRVVLGDPWAVTVLALTLVEGALLVGVLSYLPLAAEQAGAGTLVAGLVTSVYGVAVIGWSLLVRVVVRRIGGSVMLGIAGAAILAGYALLAVRADAATVAVAALLLGLAWATGHIQLQVWMSDAVLRSRPIGMALFAVALFGGGAIGAGLGGLAVAGGRLGLLFAVAAVAGGAFMIAAPVSRAGYREREA